MKTVRFGIIGCGLMGREFASAAARWCHLKAPAARPEIVAVCDVNDGARAWFTEHFSSVKLSTADYRELLAHPEVEAVYCAVPHNLHAEVYVDILRAGKHLLGEKPFGIDRAANARILEELAKHPELVVRCASEFPYYPACQMLVDWIRQDRFGRLLQVRAGFLHASDLDTDKPINWKRRAATNGEYGCMGDLGIHTQHVPFRVGWVPRDVYAVLSDIVTQRPDGKGGTVPCDTFDNATLLCTCADSRGEFPMLLETKRLSPGSTNEWYLRVEGMDASAYFTTAEPGVFHYLYSEGKNQAWCHVNIGSKPLFPTITGDIFEFGFTDSILQMWAAFMVELEGQPVGFGCFTPEETRLSHAVQTAALESHRTKRAVAVDRKDLGASPHAPPAF